MLEGMRGPFLGIYFQDINETVNKNGGSSKKLWGTAVKGSGEGYWSDHAIKSRTKTQKTIEERKTNLIPLEFLESQQVTASEPIDVYVSSKDIEPIEIPREEAIVA